MLIGSFRFYTAYKFFANHFAKTVWRNFVAFHTLLPEKASNAPSISADRSN